MADEAGEVPAAPGSDMSINAKEGEEPSPSVDNTVVVFEEEKTVEKTDSDEEVRETFGSKMSYILTLVGYAVGFGNIWRFPYLLQSKGGAAFLVPYVFMVIFLGIPTFFLEVAIGQRLQKGPVGVWHEVSPYLAGIGVMSAVLCLIVGLYYVTLIAWCLTYFFDIFRTTLRWTSCDTAVRDWEYSDDNINCEASNNGSNDPIYRKISQGRTIKKNCELCNETGASLYYWNYKILNVSPSIEDLGEFNPWILIGLIVSWFCVWAILFKGLKATGKVVYFSALFPYAVLFIFLVTGLTLPGMLNGFKVLFTPDWTKLAEAETWMVAGSQVFFSFGIAFGSLIAFASHLPHKNNSYRDTVTVALMDFGTAMLASVVIFSILGFQGTRLLEQCKKERFEEFEVKILYNATLLNQTYLATNDSGVKDLLDDLPLPHGRKRKGVLRTYDTNWEEHTDVFEGVIRQYTVGTSKRLHLPIPLQELQENSSFPKLRDCSIVTSVGSSSGTGLVFVVFADAIAQLPAPQFWAFLFYLMLFTLGIDSGFGTVEGAISGIEDLKSKMKRCLITTIVCGVLGVVGTILFSFGWGVYMLSFFDEFCANWTLMIVAFFECIAISWVYGLKRFSYDIKLMTGQRPNILMLMCWKYISPLMMLILMVTTIAGYATNGMQYSLWQTIPNKDGKLQGSSKAVPFPPVFMGLGFTIAILAVLPIPLFAILKFFNISPLGEAIPAHFPEEELQETVNFVSHDEEEKSYTPTEKALFWGGSPNSDNISRKSSSSFANRDPGVGAQPNDPTSGTSA